MLTALRDAGLHPQRSPAAVVVHLDIDLAELQLECHWAVATQPRFDPFRHSTMSCNGRRGVAGNGSALDGAQPIRNSICGKPLLPKTSICTASRVSVIRRGSVTGQLARPSAVALSSTRLVASPARSRASVLSSFVPSAKTMALSSMESVSGGCASAGPANIRGGIGAAASGSGVLRAGTPASEAYRPLQAVSSTM